MPEIEIEIRKIEASDTVTGLSLGHADFVALKNYLTKEAKKHHEQSLARTYGVYLSDEPKRVKAYITLVCGEITAEDGGNGLDNDELHYPYKHYPAVKIARLAVDRRLRDLHLHVGSQLVDLAVGIAKGTISEAVGCRFLVVDAKQQSVGFYEKCGFTAIDTDENRNRTEPVMYIDLHKI